MALLAVSLLAACGPNASRETASSPGSPSSAPGAPVAGTAGGSAPEGALGTASIAGKAVFAGAVPAAETIRMTSDSFCVKAHKGEVRKGDLLVAADGGLANVFVYVKEGIRGRYPPPTVAAVLNQKGCVYEPRVFGLVTGQPLEILNDDDTLHNVHAIGESNDSFNFGMPRQGMKVVRRFEKPEVMVKIKCDVHGWMTAWAGVLPHPFFAVSADDGSFVINNLPAGTFVLEAWHETFGTQSQIVKVGDGERKAISWTFKG